MNNKQAIKKTADFVRQRMIGEGSGHDWWHVYRVWKNAQHIGKHENADIFVVELAALLHDIADWKFHGGDDTEGPRQAGLWLKKLKIDPAVIEHVQHIILTMSFKGAGVQTKMKTIEGAIVQDSDRLDALGAIGIARTFAYGGHKGREIYNPEIKPVMHTSYKAYKNSLGTTVNHFYEKLLLLKGRMNTKTAKKIAAGRHKHMEQFLKEFLAEWEGKK